MVPTTTVLCWEVAVATPGRLHLLSSLKLRWSRKLVASCRWHQTWAPSWTHGFKQHALIASTSTLSCTK